MKLCLGTTILMTLCGTWVTTSIHAAESPTLTPPFPLEKLEFIERNQIKTSGANVRRSAKLRFALGNMMAKERDRLSTADVASMQSFYRTEPDLRQSSETLDELCVELKREDVGGSVDAYTLANLLDRSEREEDQAQLAH